MFVPYARLSLIKVKEFAIEAKTYVVKKVKQVNSKLYNNSIMILTLLLSVLLLLDYLISMRILKKR
ncbi:hypothetical protein AKA01nite_13840 [Alkalibacterium kapii]|uniref:Uncharacterized protein n=1 Tax=Alkalibacterium kapii TaxID=426704 RepID=A0A511AVU2_9LACT|nr:hypothetical protein AKA01nite_13840 [Alkalibacterium kapii]